MVQVSFPGVYVRELASGDQTVPSVSTSTTLFIGTSPRGPLEPGAPGSAPVVVPKQILDYAEFVASYGPDEALGELHTQVRQFFANGGAQAWVARIAGSGATPSTELRWASVELKGVTGVDVLRLAAREPGTAGSEIRARVDYATQAPDRTFNLSIYREVDDGRGGFLKADLEAYSEVETTPDHPRNLETLLANSELVRATILATAPPAQSALSATHLRWENAAAADAAVDAAVTAVGGNATLFARRGHDAWATVTLTNLVGGPATAARLGDRVSAAVGIPITGAFRDGAIVLEGPAGEDFSLSTGGNADIAAALGLGLDNGGVEVGAYAAGRPRPNGLLVPGVVNGGGSFDPFGVQAAFAQQLRTAVPDVTVLGPTLPVPSTAIPYTGTGARLDELDAGARSLSSLQQQLTRIADTLRGVEPRWSAQALGGRIHVFLTSGTSTSGAGHSLVLTNGRALDNAAAYALASVSGAAGAYQTGTDGANGAQPELSHYLAAFEAMERQVTGYDLMVLPRPEARPGLPDPRGTVWGAASAACRDHHAFLLVDSPAEWTSRDAARDGANVLRRGLVNDHAAVYFPWVRDPVHGRMVGPSGSVAGLMARIDGPRGVWTPPAGLDDGLVGVDDVSVRMSDTDIGVLNPLAINCIRLLPSGVVVWGARTLDGFDGTANQDFMYINVRRLTNYLEKSLILGLRFAVFEPNGAPLWRQIRATVNAFMGSLYDQGAFRGAKASDGFRVICDQTTTTGNDINLGRVNVIVQFAPRKPAEFVIIQLQQMALQAQA